MVKPGDITDELIERTYQPSGDVRVDIADFLNAAIEAGLVSPPVWTVRDKWGNLLDNDVYGLYSTPDAAESKHEDDCTAEHWKGQTDDTDI